MNKYIKLDREEVQALRDRIDLNVVTSHVCETYGYRTDWTVSVIEHWPTSSYDIAKPGWLYLGSDYVGRIVKDEDGKFLVFLDRVGYGETFSLPMKEEEDKVDYHQMTKKQLDQIARDMKIPGRSKVTQWGLAHKIEEILGVECTKPAVSMTNALEEGAMKNPEGTKKGVEKVRAALDQKKEEVIELTDNKVVVMITGHRPPQLGGYNNTEQFDKLRETLKQVFQKVADQYGVGLDQLVIVWGGALGADQIAAEAANEMDLSHFCFAPCQKWYNPWPVQAKNHVRTLVNSGDASLGERFTEFGTVVEGHAILHVNNRTYRNAQDMMDRNKAMVNAADVCVAVWDKTKTTGGTANCVGYIRSTGKFAIQVHPFKYTDQGLMKTTVLNKEQVQ